MRSSWSSIFGTGAEGAPPKRVSASSTENETDPAELPMLKNVPERIANPILSGSRSWLGSMIVLITAIVFGLTVSRAPDYLTGSWLNGARFPAP
jgi:hypothetical protein